MVTVGRLNRRIELQKPVEAADGSGGTTTTWETFAATWAYIEPLRGERLIEAKGFQTEISHRFTIRYRTDLYSGWRIKMESRTFSILHLVNPFEAHRALELYCREHI